MSQKSLYLQDRDYFKLESHDMQEQLKKAELEIEKLKNEVCRKDIMLLTKRIEDMQRVFKERVEKIQSIGTTIENIKISKSKVRDEITSSLDLPKDWGYNPETLEIILGD